MKMSDMAHEENIHRPKHMIVCVLTIYKRCDPNSKMTFVKYINETDISIIFEISYERRPIKQLLSVQE